MDYNINSVTGIPLDTYDDINKLGMNPIILTLIILVILFYFLFFSSLGLKQESFQDFKDIGLLEIILWSVFILLILLNGMSYFFNVNIVASFKNLFTGIPELDMNVQMPLEDEWENGDGDNGYGDNGEITDDMAPIDEITSGKQVFHVPGNKYTYENAKALCKAYGARLADYKDMKTAHNEGADWCSYGWSEDQMAFFPTQMKKWKKLQKIKGHEHDCGRPGINGGYIANPNVRFGVNCVGYKPKINQEESDLMRNTSLYPKTQKELDFDNRVKYWRRKIPNILVAPFNYNNWSVI